MVTTKESMSVFGRHFDASSFKLKYMFNFLMILFSFTERVKREPEAPVITVPTN
jgi:hypothetical protein